MLGPVEVRRDGEPVTVPAGKTTEVLMHLALTAGEMVRTERLFDDIWGSDAAGVGRNALQSKISQLRRALGDPALVVGTSAGYTLAIDPASVDVSEAIRLAGVASDLRQVGEAAGCARACSDALALFRGEGLFGASDAEWLVPQRTRLEEVRLQLIEDQLGARLDLGAAGELVSELEMLTAAYPLREGLSALLITALYRDNRQADALAAYRSVRERLADELGLDPGPELQKLEQQVLDQDPDLAGPAHATVSARAPTGEGLPPISSPMIGRDREAADLGDRITVHRLVTLVGPAGVGKTRLAIEVARHADAADGTWLVRLENAPTSDTVLETVADALHAGAATIESIRERLRGADTLIVLDNCEHVVDAAAEIVRGLLSAAAGVRVLATSQLPLGLDGEHVYALAPLSMADSLTLFTLRAREHGRQPVSDDEATSTLAAVCRSLDGLPLAIELAAARTKSLTIAEIARRLDDRFRLLADPTSRRPERQRRLSSAIAWSYDLLFPDDQRGLMALACFVGGAPLDAAEAVLDALGVPNEAAVDVVSRLVDRSLVVFDTSGGTPRYRLLDSVRTFALERLEESGDAGGAHHAHAAWIAAAADAAAHGTRGPNQGEHVDFARRERANFDAALSWARDEDPALAVTIAGDLGWTWVVLGDAVGAQRLSAALDAPTEAGDRERRVRALLSLAWLEASAGDVSRAQEAIDEAFALLGPDADRLALANARWYSGYVLAQQGRFRESLHALDTARVVLRELDQRWEEAASTVLTAHCLIGLGDPAAAAAACVEAARLLEDVADPWLLVHTEAMLGGVAQGEGRYAEACEHLARAAAAAGQSGFAATEAYHRANLGRAQHQAGDLDAARDTLELAIELARATGDLRVAALARVRLGRVLLAQGDPDAALAAVGAARDWYRSAGGGDGARLAECLFASMGGYPDPDRAIAHLETLVDEARAAADPEVEALALEALARLTAR
jgi:predicted ATPase/DNA-binding SARP family transcriptional activator